MTEGIESKSRGEISAERALKWCSVRINSAEYIRLHFPQRTKYFLCIVFCLNCESCLTENIYPRSPSVRWRVTCWWLWISSTIFLWRTCESSEALNCMKDATPWPSFSTTDEMDTSALDNWASRTWQVSLSVCVPLFLAKQIPITLVFVQ